MSTDRIGGNQRKTQHHHRVHTLILPGARRAIQGVTALGALTGDHSLGITHWDSRTRRGEFGEFSHYGTWRASLHAAVTAVPRVRESFEVQLSPRPRGTPP